MDLHQHAIRMMFFQPLSIIDVRRSAYSASSGRAIRQLGSYRDEIDDLAGEGITDKSIRTSPAEAGRQDGGCPAIVILWDRSFAPSPTPRRSGAADQSGGWTTFPCLWLPPSDHCAASWVFAHILSPARLVAVAGSFSLAAGALPFGVAIRSFPRRLRISRLNGLPRQSRRLRLDTKAAGQHDGDADANPCSLTR